LQQVGVCYTDASKGLCVVFKSTFIRICCELLTTTVEPIGLFLKIGSTLLHSGLHIYIYIYIYQYRVPINLSWIAYISQYSVPINLSWIAYIYIFPSHLDSFCICILKDYFKHVLQHYLSIEAYTPRLVYSLQFFKQIRTSDFASRANVMLFTPLSIL